MKKLLLALIALGVVFGWSGCASKSKEGVKKNKEISQEVYERSNKANKEAMQRLDRE